MRFSLTLVLATGFAAKALAQMPDTVPSASAPIATRLTLDTLPNARTVRFFERGDSSQATHHGKHALIGTAAGAAVGIVAGLVYLNGADVFQACSNSACTRQRNGIAFFTLSVDGAIGAGVGALVGALVP